MTYVWECLNKRCKHRWEEENAPVSTQEERKCPCPLCGEAEYVRKILQVSALHGSRNMPNN